MFRRVAVVDPELADLRSVAASLRAEVADCRRQLELPVSWLDRLMTKRVLVHQTNDSTLEGLLVGVWEDGISLRSAALLGSGGHSTPMAGEVFVPRAQVALVQVDG